MRVVRVEGEKVDQGTHYHGKTQTTSPRQWALDGKVLAKNSGRNSGNLILSRCGQIVLSTTRHLRTWTNSPQRLPLVSRHFIFCFGPNRESVAFGNMFKHGGLLRHFCISLSSSSTPDTFGCGRSLFNILTPAITRTD